MEIVLNGELCNRFLGVALHTLSSPTPSVSSAGIEYDEGLPDSSSSYHTHTVILLCTRDVTDFDSCHNTRGSIKTITVILLMSSSLSSVVSSLVRASMGTSISNMVTDDDLDRHVAELIVKEAKKKAERYGQQGIRAYISSDLYVYHPYLLNANFKKLTLSIGAKAMCLGRTNVS